jgi:hypothetical protein
MTDFLEAAMLTAFSVSWYCSIWKMLTTGRASGKSLGFVLLICAGYVCGIASKIVVFAETGAVSGLVLLYAWNLLVTGFDAFLVWHYGRGAEGAPQHALFPRLAEAANKVFARNASRAEAGAGSTPGRAAAVK